MRPIASIPLPVLFLLLALSSKATTIDSLVRWNEISFTTPFEQSAFNVFLKEETRDYVSMFLGNSTTATSDQKYFQQKFNEALTEINNSGALKKKNDKKVKQIYQVIHSRFLVKYELENSFYEIIKNGNYNCVTATALYAMFFEKLNIPYVIKEEPTHVYLVAYPNADNILVETTAPFSGLLAFDVAFKANYVNTLKNQKIIGGSELTGSVDELFNKYYFGNENITLSKLVGIHYMNDGLVKREHNDLAGAYEQMKKAYLFYPNTRSEYLLMIFNVARLEDTDLDPIKKASFVGTLSRFKKAGITLEMVQGEFYQITQNVLSKQNDKELYKKCYEQTIRYITDPAIAKEIGYIFYYENGRVYYNQGNYSRAKPYFSKALEFQPNNADLGGTLVSCLAQTFRNERNNTAIIDSLELYKKRFPSLEENTNFNSMMAQAYAIEFGAAYEKGNATKGEKYQRLFEELYKSDKDITLLNPDAVGKAYSEASVYYFKKNQREKAKQILEKGLQIVPDNYQLRMRRQMINGG